MSEEVKKKLEEDLKNIEESIKNLKPISEEAEKLAKIAFEKMKEDKTLGYLRENLNKDLKKEEIANLLNWWDSVPVDLKQKITKQEAKKIVELNQRLNRLLK